MMTKRLILHQRNYKKASRLNGTAVTRKREIVGGSDFILRSGLGISKHPPAWMIPHDHQKGKAITARISKCGTPEEFRKQPPSGRYSCNAQTGAFFAGQLH